METETWLEEEVTGSFYLPRNLIKYLNATLPFFNLAKCDIINQGLMLIKVLKTN